MRTAAVWIRPASRSRRSDICRRRFKSVVPPPALGFTSVMAGRAIILASIVVGLGNVPLASAANPDPGERGEALLQRPADHRVRGRQPSETVGAPGARPPGDR